LFLVINKEAEKQQSEQNDDWSLSAWLGGVATRFNSIPSARLTLKSSFRIKKNPVAIS